MENLYQDPILKKYADLIKSQTNVFKRIYFGDPIRIGASEYPALILAKVDTTVSNHSNAEDEYQIRISMTIVMDVRDTISDDKEMVKGVNSLYNLVEGRNADDYTLKPESILNILRHNVELDSGKNLRTDLSTQSRVDYGMTINKRAPESWGIEATIEFTTNFIQNR